jgi:acyl-CoA hydrolase
VVYVAVDDAGKPTEVTPLALVTDEDKRLWQEACLRQRDRLQARRQSP